MCIIYLTLSMFNHTKRQLNHAHGEPMSYQEKSVIASLITTALAFGAYFIVVSGMHHDGRFEGAEATRQIGKVILIVIGASIVLNIVMQILTNILHAIVTNEQNPSFVVDERDKLIELRGLQLMLFVMGIGFVLSMIMLTIGQSAFISFNIIVFSFALGDVAGNIRRLFLYQRGF